MERTPHEFQSPFDGPHRIGLLAGWGRYPIVVAEALKRQGHQVFCLGIKGHADQSLRKICNDFTWVGLAKLGLAIRYFQRVGVSTATMAGKIHKVLIYQKWSWLRHLPDLRFLSTFYPHFITLQSDRRDDTLLGAFVRAFADRGITMAPATDYVPELLVRSGFLAGRPPKSREEKDIEFGWEMAKRMGELDIGQSICVKDRAVLAVEAIEGTDASIERAGSLCPSGGFVVVKVAKPQQDMRFDVPTVGLGTLRTMAAAGARLLALEAGRSVLLDQPEFVHFAKHQRITVIAFQKKSPASLAA